MHSKELDCETVKEKLFDLVTDILDDTEKSAVLLHIENCPTCTREYEIIKSILSAASDIKDVEPPVGLQTAVFDRIKSESRKSPISFSRYFKRAVGIVVPIAACAALTVGIYQSGLYDQLINSDDMVSSGITTEIHPSDYDSGSSVTADSTPADENAEQTEVSADHSTVAPEFNAEDDAPIKYDIKSNTETDRAERSSQTHDTAKAENETQEENSNNAVAAADNSKSSDPSHLASGSPDTASAESPREKGTAAAAENTEAPPPDVTLSSSASSNSRITNDSAVHNNDTKQDDSHSASAYSAVPADAHAKNSDEVISNSDTGNIIPASCTVATDDPAEFAAQFGVDTDKDADIITFTVLSSEYVRLEIIAAEHDAEITNSQKESTGEVAVTVTKK